MEGNELINIRDQCIRKDNNRLCPENDIFYEGCAKCYLYTGPDRNPQEMCMECNDQFYFQNSYKGGCKPSVPNTCDL